MSLSQLTRHGDANCRSVFQGADRSAHRRAAHHRDRSAPTDRADVGDAPEGDESDLDDDQDDVDDDGDDIDDGGRLHRPDSTSTGPSSSRTALSGRPSKSADRCRRAAGQPPPRNFHVFTRAQYDLMVRCLELQRNAADLPRLRELWKTVADTARGRKRWKRLQENLALVANHESAPRYKRITWLHSSLIIAPQERTTPTQM
ncbi:hypothetical protein AMAG_03757 [Allomyces macrogynus ATCC 38327]|uniref:Uncharacterized protein n=1 Tax=Allomyces macrogynus (strain ATCC 38327) TaxID=578462 RepID=A0A0L0SAA5_ALLM3|nr:hypothetical protein AMAG_03757 [Allomyces macrogynus ATCC 38327]|eukprot:KNE59483.1 hypothetical protein AMAG_03757 [Allomyces macrogynus ATCC 38327]